MTASQHTIAGMVLTMPVKIRKANQHMAMFSVDDLQAAVVDQVLRGVGHRAAPSWS
jgi:hypothetical protein